MKRFVIPGIALLLFSCAYGDTGGGSETYYSMDLHVEYTSSWVAGEYIYMALFDSSSDIDSWEPKYNEGRDSTDFTQLFSRINYTSCYLMVYADLDGSGRVSTGDPYMIYNGAADSVNAAVIPLTEGSAADISMTFDNSQTWPASP